LLGLIVDKSDDPAMSDARTHPFIAEAKSYDNSVLTISIPTIYQHTSDFPLLAHEVSAGKYLIFTSTADG
jgi:hypothetical protein